jgi:radical SAM superfamily enzyme YgiQ (UPF0313 family)
VLHDTKVFDGGAKLGTGVPFLISHARRRAQLAERVELRQMTWPLRAGELPSEGMIDRVVQGMLADAPDVVGASLQGWSQALFVEAIRRVKRQRPEVVTVVGGPTATDMGKTLMKLTPEIDFLFTGFAEHSFADFLEALGDPSPDQAARLEAIAGMCFRDDAGSVSESAGAAFDPKSLDECGAPIQDGLLPPRGEVAQLNVEWTRGCPFSCAFCTWPRRQRRIAHFSSAYVARDVAWALGAGYESVLICDPAINFDTAWLRVLVESLEAADPEQRITFDAFLQYPCLSAEQAELLPRVRWGRLMLGLQTDDEEGLRALNRPRFVRERFERAIEWARPACTPTVDVMTGVPGDDPDKIRRRIDYLLKLDCRVAVFPLLALPGTEIWQHRQKFGLEVDERHFHLVRSLPTMPEDAYRRAVEELERIAAGGAPIEVAGYNILFAEEVPPASGPAARGEEELTIWVREILSRLARLSPKKKAELGITGWAPKSLALVPHADVKAIRICLRSGANELHVDAFDARQLDSPRARGERLAFLSPGESAVGGVLCEVLAVLDRRAEERA